MFNEQLGILNAPVLIDIEAINHTHLPASRGLNPAIERYSIEVAIAV